MFQSQCLSSLDELILILMESNLGCCGARVLPMGQHLGFCFVSTSSLGNIRN